MSSAASPSNTTWWRSSGVMLSYFIYAKAFLLKPIDLSSAADSFGRFEIPFSYASCLTYSLDISCAAPKALAIFFAVFAIHSPAFLSQSQNPLASAPLSSYAKTSRCGISSAARPSKMTCWRSCGVILSASIWAKAFESKPSSPSSANESLGRLVIPFSYASCLTYFLDTTCAPVKALAIFLQVFEIHSPAFLSQSQNPLASAALSSYAKTSRCGKSSAARPSKMTCWRSSGVILSASIWANAFLLNPRDLSSARENFGSSVIPFYWASC